MGQLGWCELANQLSRHGALWKACLQVPQRMLGSDLLDELMTP